MTDITNWLNDNNEDEPLAAPAAAPRPPLAAQSFAQTQTPDEVAADLTTADRAGVPRPAVMAQRESFARIAQANYIESQTRSTPNLQGWLGEHPDNYALAQDDTENLSVFERIGKMFEDLGNNAEVQQLSDISSALTQGIVPAYINSAARGRRQDMASVADQYVEGQRDVEYGALAYRAHQAQRGRGEPLNETERARLDELATRTGQEDWGAFIIGPTARLAPQMLGSIQRAAEGGADRINEFHQDVYGTSEQGREAARRALNGDTRAGIDNLIAGSIFVSGLPFAAVGGVAGGYLAFGNEQEVGQAYDQMVRAGIDPDIASTRADEYGAWATAIEFAADALGIKLSGAGRLASRAVLRESVLAAERPALRAASAIGATAVDQGAEEAAQQLAQIIHQDLAQQQTQTGSSDVGAAWREAMTPDSIKQIILSGWIGAQGGAGMAIIPTSVNFALDVRAAQAAETNAQVWEQQTQAAQASLTGQRHPPTMESAIGAMDQSAVFIDADKFVEHFQAQGVNPYDVADELGIGGESLGQALNSHAQISIPTSTFAARVLRIPAHASLAEHTRRTPTDDTPAEAKMAQERFRANVEQLASEVEAAQTDNDIGQAVEQHIRNLAQNEGGFRPEIASQYAKLAAALPRALLARARATDPAYAATLEPKLRRLFGEGFGIAGVGSSEQAGESMAQRARGVDAGPVRSERWDPPEGVRVPERMRKIGEMAANGASNEWIAEEMSDGDNLVTAKNIAVTLSQLKTKLGGNAPWEAGETGNRPGHNTQTGEEIVPIERLVQRRAQLRAAGYPEGRGRRGAINTVLAEQFGVDPGRITSRLREYDRAQAKAAEAAPTKRRSQIFDLPTIEARQEWYEEPGNVISAPIPGEAMDSRSYGFALDNGYVVTVEVAPEPGGATTISWTFLHRTLAGDEPFSDGHEHLTVREKGQLLSRLQAVIEADMAEFNRDAYVWTPESDGRMRANRAMVARAEGTWPYHLLRRGSDDYLARDGVDVTLNGAILNGTETPGEWDQDQDADSIEARKAAFNERLLQELGSADGTSETGGRSDDLGRGRMESAGGSAGTGRPGTEAELNQSAPVWFSSVERSGRIRLDEVIKPESARKLAENVFGAEMAAAMPLEVVDGGVLSMLQHDQVRRAVIEAIPVDVVDILAGVNLTPDQLFSDPDMIAARLPADSRNRTGAGIVSALRFTHASVAAKLRTILASGRDAEILPALRASQLSPRDVAGIISPSALFHLGASGLPKEAAAANPVAEPFPSETGRPLVEKLAPAELAELLNAHEDIRSKESPLTQRTVGEGNRGAINFGSLDKWKNGEFSDVTIRMTKASDLSTFLHEFGHLAHLTLESLATDQNGPEEFKSMWDNTLDWFGLTQEQWDGMNLSQREPYYERWARTFEAYLMEGKAPSLSLREAFAAFKSWLLGIYRSVLSLDHNLNPQIRDVFDRLLATDAELAEARAAMGADFKLDRANFPSMTDEEWAQMQAAAKEAREAEDAELRARVMDSHVRKEKRWFRAERNRVRPTATADVDAEPARQAYEWLAFGEKRPEITEYDEDGNEIIRASTLPDDLPEMKLDPQILIAEYGENIFNELPVGLQPARPEDVDAALESAMELKRAGKVKAPALRLAAWVKKQGGIKDTGGEVRQAMGSGRARPGVLNNESGLDPDALALRAQEAGYFGPVLKTQLLQRAWAIETDRGPITIDPSDSEMLRLTRPRMGQDKTKTDSLRYIISAKGRMFVANAFDMTHDDIARAVRARGIDDLVGYEMHAGDTYSHGVPTGFIRRSGDELKGVPAREASLSQGKAPDAGSGRGGQLSNDARNERLGNRTRAQQDELNRLVNKKEMERLNSSEQARVAELRQLGLWRNDTELTQAEAKLGRAPVSGPESGRTLYHGTPNTFDQFDDARIANPMTAGWGHYFSDNEKLAAMFRRGETGNVYRVNIADGPIADYDVPLSQSPEALAAVQDIWRTLPARSRQKIERGINEMRQYTHDVGGFEDALPNMKWRRAEALLRQAMGERQVSQAMRDRGIIGTRFADPRTGGSGYAIFQGGDIRMAQAPDGGASPAGQTPAASSNQESQDGFEFFQGALNDQRNGALGQQAGNRTPAQEQAEADERNGTASDYGPDVAGGSYRPGLGNVPLDPASPWRSEAPKASRANGRANAVERQARKAALADMLADTTPVFETQDEASTAQYNHPLTGWHDGGEPVDMRVISFSLKPPTRADVSWAEAFDADTTHVWFEVGPDWAMLRAANSNPRLRGSGAGTQMHMDAIDALHALGKRVFSDSSMSEDAIRVWRDVLPRFGYTVVPVSEPTYSESTKQWNTPDGLAQFEVLPRSGAPSLNGIMRRVNLPAPFIGAADVVVNPTRGQIESIIRAQEAKGQTPSVRWGVDELGRLLAWDGKMTSHAMMAEATSGKFQQTGEIENDLEIDSVLSTSARLRKGYTPQQVMEALDVSEDTARRLLQLHGKLAAPAQVTQEMEPALFQDAPDPTKRVTVREFIDALVADLKGERPVYSSLDEEALEAYQNRTDQQRWFEKRGVDLSGSKAEIRAQIVDALNREAENPNGMSPDDVAEWFTNPDGTPAFTSGNHLISALKALKPREQAIEDRIDALVERAHGDPMRDGTVSEEARQAAHNEAQAHAIELDLMAIEKAAGKRRTPSMKAAKAYAADQVQDMTTAQVRSYDRFLAGERRAARLAFEAVAKGDMHEAGKQKARQLASFRLYVEARSAAENLDRIQDRWRRYRTSQGTRSAIGATATEQIDSILATIETGKPPRWAQPIQEWVDAVSAAGVQPDEFQFHPEVVDQVIRRPLRQMSYREVLGLNDTLRNIEFIGRGVMRMRKDQEAKRIADVQAELRERIATEWADVLAKKQSLVAPNATEKSKRELLHIHAVLLKNDYLFRLLDGLKDGGPWMRLMADAQSAENDLHQRSQNAASEFLTLVRDRYTSKQFREMLSKRIYIDAIEDSRTKAQIISYALNMGNEYNRDALLRGEKWDQRQLEAVLGLLDDNDWTFVQSLWNYVGQWKEESFALDERTRGSRPTEVIALPFTTPTGKTLSGGYWPVSFSSDRSEQAAQREARETIIGEYGGAVRTATTNRGRLKGRVGTGDQPLSDDFMGILAKHVHDSLRDITHRELVITLRRVKADRELRNMIAKVAGRDGVRAIDEWVHRLAARTPGNVFGDYGRLAAYIRRSATSHAMGFKVSVATLNLLGHMQAVPRNGIVAQLKQAGLSVAVGFPDLLRRHLQAIATGQKEVSARVALVYDKSDMMRLRRNTFDRDLNEIKGDLVGRRVGAILPKQFEDTLQILNAYTDQVVSVPTWLAAYESARNGKVKGVDGEQASIDYADSVVRMVLSAGGTKDLAALMASNNQWQRLMTMFMGWASGFYNQMTVEQIPGVMSGKISLSRFAANMVWIWLLPAVITMAFYGQNERKDDEDELAYWLRVIGTGLIYPLQTVPLLRDAMAALVQDYPPRNAATTPIETAVKFRNAIERQDERQMVKQGYMLGGQITGAPAQFYVTGDYVADMAQGNEDPLADPMDAINEAFLRDTR